MRHLAGARQHTHREAGREVLDEGVELDAVRTLLQKHVHALERSLCDVELRLSRQLTDETAGKHSAMIYTCLCKKTGMFRS